MDYNYIIFQLKQNLDNNGLIKEASWWDFIGKIMKPTINRMVTFEGGQITNKFLGNTINFDTTKNVAQNVFNKALPAWEAAEGKGLTKVKNFVDNAARSKLNFFEENGKVVVPHGSPGHTSNTLDAIGDPARYYKAFQEEGVGGVAKLMKQDWNNKQYYTIAEDSNKIIKGQDGKYYKKTWFGKRESVGEFIDNTGKKQLIFKNRAPVKYFKRMLTPQGMFLTSVGTGIMSGDIKEGIGQGIMDGILWGPFRPIGEAKSLYDLGSSFLG